MDPQKCTKICKYCRKEYLRKWYTDKQWSKNNPCCDSCITNIVDKTDEDYIDCIIGGEKLRNEMGSIRCKKCGNSYSTDMFSDGIYKYLYAFQKGKRLDQRGYTKNPLETAVCLKCNPKSH